MENTEAKVEIIEIPRNIKNEKNEKKKKVINHYLFFKLDAIYFWYFIIFLWTH